MSGASKVIATKQCYQKVFRSPDGEKVLHDLMKRFYNGSVFDSDPVNMAYREGQRETVAHILQQLLLDLGKLRQQIEQAERYDNELP